MQHTQLTQQLRSLKLTGMADAFEQQTEQPGTYSDLSFEERLGLLTDREDTHRSNNKVERLLKAAKLKLHACAEDIDYTHPRGLTKSTMAALLSGQWIEHHQNVLITGPTGAGSYCTPRYVIEDPKISGARSCARGCHRCRIRQRRAQE